MYSPVYTFIEKSRYCTSFEELCNLVRMTISNLGFERYAYEAEPLEDIGDTPPVFAHTFPEEWIDYYMSQRYYEIDPVVVAGKNAVRPFQWADVMYTPDLSQKMKDYNAEAASYGLTDGIGIPIPRADGRKTIFSITGNHNAKELKHLIETQHEQLISIACVFHSIAGDMLRKNQQHVENPLTERERECVLWTTKGKTSWEISQILHVSERTVNFHLENAKRKVGASNKYQLIVECITRMYVNP